MIKFITHEPLSKKGQSLITELINSNVLIDDIVITCVYLIVYVENGDYWKGVVDKIFQNRLIFYSVHYTNDNQYICYQILLKRNNLMKKSWKPYNK